MTQILIFGDSITYGAWDSEGGWVQRLRKDIDKKNISEKDFYCLVYNLGISGDIETDLLERLDFETKMRLDDDEETIIVFAIGINDSQFLNTEKRKRTQSQNFKSNIEQLITKAKRFSSKIIFIGLNPVDEEKTVPVWWNKKISYKNDDIKENDSIIKKICKENKVYFIELFDNFSKQDYKKYLHDGLHPNSQGHERIYELVKDLLIKNKFLDIK